MTAHRWLKLAVLGALVAAAATLAAAAIGATGKGVPADFKPYDGTPEFTAQGGVDPQFLTGARTIPHWTFKYSDPQTNVTYPITMVGSDPRQGGSTTVKTVIVPLKMNFVAGNQDTSILNAWYGNGFVADKVAATFDGTTAASKVLASPIFSSYKQPTDMGGNTAQYGDAFMRAQFNKIGSSYHVKLDNVKTFPTVTIDVPQNQGVAYHRPAGALAGIADYKWFSAQLQNLINQLQIDPTTVPIFLTDQVLLYDGNDYRNCCVLGYHGAAMPVGLGGGSANGNGNNPVQTFIYAAYAHPNTYSGFTTPNGTLPNRGIADVHGLSHEVAEWLDDPFINNAVQPWLTPTAPQYGCTGVLETGDPVVGVWYPLPGNAEAGYNGVWHPEDEVFLNWFARNGQPASLSPWKASYFTFMGPRTTSIGGPFAAFGSVATGC